MRKMPLTHEKKVSGTRKTAFHFTLFVVHTSWTSCKEKISQEHTRGQSARPKFLQIENLSSRGKIILWRDKIPPDEKKSTALGDVPDSGNLCRNHAPNFLWRKVTDPLWRGCMPSGRSSTKTRFLQVNVDLLNL